MNPERKQLNQDMSHLHLSPLWEVLHALVPQKPTTPCVPALWKYEQVRPYMMRAGELITAEEAVRRVLNAARKDMLAGESEPSMLDTGDEEQ